MAPYSVSKAGIICFTKALAREVVSRFARERAAEGDRVGLIVFGEDAFTLCPLTGTGMVFRVQGGRYDVVLDDGRRVEATLRALSAGPAH